MKAYKIFLLLGLVFPLFGFINKDDYKNSNYYDETLIAADSQGRVCCKTVRGGTFYNFTNSSNCSKNNIVNDSYCVQSSTYSNEKVCCCIQLRPSYFSCSYTLPKNCTGSYGQGSCTEGKTTYYGSEENAKIMGDEEYDDGGNYKPGSGGTLGGSGSNDPVEEIGPFCVETREIWRIGGYIVWAIKVLVPALLIVFVSIDFAKASFSDDADPKKHISSLLKRVASALIIFFIPTVLGIIINSMGEVNDVKEDWTACASCLFTPKNC